MPEKTCKHEWTMASEGALCFNAGCHARLTEEEVQRRLNTYDAVLEFIKYLYAGDLEEIDKRYDELPDEVKKAIESHPIYGGEDVTTNEL